VGKPKAGTAPALHAVHRANPLVQVTAARFGEDGADW